MLDNETKRRIDSARDILVGKIPDPKSQVEQITIALIYKFMDDMDKEAIELGGNASFFTGEYEKYGWSKIFDPRLGGFDMLALYSEAIVKLNLNPNIPQLFRDIFKNAYLPYRDPETLKLFLKTINEFHYDHSEKLGDAFEYLLSILGSQGDAGQFRTPRHIIDFIVNILQPKKNETILDPACGTAGFLISSYKYILKENTNKTKGDLLTPNDRKKIMQQFTGYDISPDMVRLSLVNMYLHNFTLPKIYEYDTLTSEDRWGDYFDIIMANPPFMSPTGGIKPHKRFTIQAKRSEALFVDYIAEHINPTTGRAGIIIPEGVIFKSETAFKSLRKMLVDKNYLYAVVSLPAGIFNPYSGVKTSVLLMDKTIAKKTGKILFVKIENDGFDLGAQRKAIAKNDLTDALEVINNYQLKIKNDEAIEALNGNYLLVDKEKIKSNGDYNLSIDRYKINARLIQGKYELIKLEAVCEFVRGVVYSKDDEVDDNGWKILRANNINVNSGNLNLADVKQISKSVNVFEKQKLKAQDIFICTASGSAEHIGKTAFIEHNTDYYFGGFMGVIRCKENILPRYLFYQLRNEKFNIHLNNFIAGANIKNLKSEILNSYTIPLPPLSIQQEIVNKIEGWQKIIDGAKQIAENYKPQIDINPDWEMVKLGEVCDKSTDNIDPNKFSGNIKYIGLEDIESNSGEIVGEIENRYENIKSAKTKFQVGNILYGKLRPNLNKVYLSKINGICSTDIMVLKTHVSVLMSEFLYQVIRGKSFNNKVLIGLKGAQLPRISFDYFSSIEIPLPPLPIQQQIVNRIKQEQQLINANKQLIQIFEQKIKDEINKLWQTDTKEYSIEDAPLSLVAEE